jgi:PAS domain S-box-containing protein
MTFEQFASEQKPGVLHFGGARMAMFDIEAGFWGLRRQIEALVGPRLANSVLQQAGANGGASFARSFIQDPAEEAFAESLRDCLAAYQAAGFGKFSIEQIEPFHLDDPLAGSVIIQAEDTFEAWAAQEHGKRHQEPVCAYAAGVLVGFVNVLAGRQDIVCVEQRCQAQGEAACRFELLPVAASEDQPDSVVAVDPDPALSRRLNLLEILFDRMPMGIVLLDTDMKVRRFNPTWAEFVKRYHPSGAKSIVPGDDFNRLMPGLEDTIKSIFDQVLTGETVSQQAFPLDTGDVISYWDSVIAPLFENRQVVGIIQVITDVTERVQAEQALQEKQRALSTLISNLPGMAYRCKNDPHWSMEFVSQGSLDLTGYRPEELVDNHTISYGDLIHPEDRQAIQDEIQAALEEGRSFQLTYRLVTREGEKWVWEQGQGVYDEAGELVALEGFITDITERVMARKNLQQRVEERTREFSSLLDISSNLASTLDLEQLLDLILDQLGAVLDYDAASIMILQDEILKIIAYRGPIEREEALEIQFSVQDARANREVIQKRAPVIIDDIYGEDTLASAVREVAGDQLETTYGYLRCWMGVPLVVKDQVVGMLTLDHRETCHYTPTEAELALAFANQAAVAIENARLYQETERRAKENEALFTVQQAITSRLEIDEVLQMIADEAKRLTDADISAVYLLEGDQLEISYVSGDVPDSIRGYRLSLDDSIAGLVVRTQKAVVIPDTWDDPRVDRSASDQVQARSLLIVPLVSGEGPIGTITVANRAPGDFPPEDERLLTRLAANVVIGVENARLYQAEHDRRQVAEGLREILAILNSDLPLDEILETIVAQACRLLDSTAGVAYQIRQDEEIVEIEALCNMPDAFSEIGTLPLIDTQANRAILEGRPYAATELKERLANVDLSAFPPDPGVRAWRSIIGEHFCAYLYVPIVIKEQVYGAISLFYDQDRKFPQDEIDLAVSLADQAALAIENAQLRSQVAQSAIAAERDRLARDLHDAVTQTLFSTSLIAEVLPRIWEQNPEQGRARLEEIRTLTRGALAEMRSLLMELRPSALIDTALPDLLRQLTEAFAGRSGVPVQLNIEGECQFEPDVKVAVYRVAQEALNNVAKHARAQSCRVALRCSPEKIDLTIRDDGGGFDPESVPPDSLGVGIMRERAEQIGAELQIDSTMGEGTRVELIWKNEE